MLIAHLAITWMIIGFIWVVQIIVYPQFLKVREPEFRLYHFSHCFRIGLIIVPLFLLETGSAAWLLYKGLRDTLFLSSLGMIPVIMLSTAIWQAPMHTRLAQGRDEAVILSLIRTNWVRTAAWTARGILLLFAAC
jgi:hypothetical protein